MAHWIITSKREPAYTVRLGDCDDTHARSVVDQLLVEPSFPSDLTLTEVDGPASVKPKHGRLYRLLRR